MNVLRERFSKLALQNRLPKITQITPVYAMIVLIVYSWTTLQFFWKLPSWLHFLSLTDILSVFAYAMATNLLESLFVLLIPLALAVVLPPKWFSDKFVVYGSSLALLLLGYAMYFSLKLKGVEGVLITIPAIAVIGLLMFGIEKIGIARKAIEILSDRAIVFLYLSIPISLISLCVVIVRNLL